MRKLLIGVSALSLVSCLGFNLHVKEEVKSIFAEEPQQINEKVVLKIKNCYDYIYVNDPESGYDEPDLIKQFEQYAKTRGFNNVEVVYSCFDTPETLYSQMATGKGGYDLVCPSEYMIQKMVIEDMLQPLNRPDKNELLGNYNKYASKYIRNRLESIEAEKKDGTVVTLGDYAVGYMWGTLGMVFNPYYHNYDTYELVQDMEHFDVLWDVDYNGTMSIKDSIRDTYACVLMQVYEEELMGYRSKYEDNVNYPDYGAEQYHADVQKVFDRIDNDTIEKVRNSLNSLKSNIFGMEVDSGKNDIVQGKIGINLAWSGDAVYSIDLGEDQDQTLCYALPLEGSNIWFDGWVMPKDPNRDPNVEKLAYIFLDFLSDPEYAAKNVDYTGYTSFIGGDDILELMREWYDLRSEDVYYYDEDDNQYQVGYLGDGGEFVALTYDDSLTAGHDSSLDSKVLYYDNEGIYSVLYADDEEKIKKTYSDILVMDNPEVIEEFGIQKVDLSYFFKDTLSVDYTEKDMYFYTDEYYFSCEDNQGDTYLSKNVGRQFYTQFPDEETITRCCIMKDYGDSLELLLKMWEKFKSNALPTWAVIIFVIEVAGAGFGVTYYRVTKKKKLALRKQRVSQARK